MQTTPEQFMYLLMTIITVSLAVAVQAVVSSHGRLAS
jgi:hypothetical protein